MKTLRYNLSLLRKTRASFDIKIVHSLKLMFTVYNGAASPSRWIRLNPLSLFSKKYPALLLHEIGHIESPEGFDDWDTVAELAAWEWALEYMHKQGIIMYGSTLSYIYSCYISYLTELPSKRLRALALSEFTRTACDKFINPKEK